MSEKQSFSAGRTRRASKCSKEDQACSTACTREANLQECEAGSLDEVTEALKHSDLGETDTRSDLGRTISKLARRVLTM